MIALYWIFIALLCLNLVAFVVYGIDKHRAKKSLSRISQATLLGIAFMGGALGAWTAMYTLRHKTRHAKFVLLVPIFLAAHIYLLYQLITYH